MNTSPQNQEAAHQWSQFTMVPAALIYYNRYAPQEANLKGMEQLTLIHLLSYAFGSTVVFPSQERLADDIGTTRKSISKYLNSLVKKGWLQKQGNGHKANNSYDLLPALNRLRGVDKKLAMGNVAAQPPKRTQRVLNDDPDDF